MAINLTDQKVFTSNGSAHFEVGSNLSTLTVSTIIANGSVGSAGEVLASDGDSVYWTNVAGSTGYTGSQGIQGYTGSQGEQGIQGYTGSQGVIGYTGSQGEQGIQGYTGSQGDLGIQGYTGSQGEQGIQGYTGSQGEQGIQGYTGSQGDQGLQGYTGSQGDIGYTGSQGPTVYPSAGIAVSTGSIWDTSKTSPSGDIVGTTDSQTLTNKTIEAGTFTNGYTEEVYALSGTEINPANGGIQTKTLGAGTTFTETIADGQSVVLMLNPSTFSVTWPTVSWVSPAGTPSTPPTLKASVVNVIVLWQVGGTLYGVWAGSV